MRRVTSDTSSPLGLGLRARARARARVRVRARARAMEAPLCSVLINGCQTVRGPHVADGIPVPLVK